MNDLSRVCVYGGNYSRFRELRGQLERFACAFLVREEAASFAVFRSRLCGRSSTFAVKPERRPLRSNCEFEVDPLACPTCRSAMRLVAFITQVSVIDQILTHLRARAAPAAHAARSPPSTRAPASRRTARAARPGADAPTPS